MQKMTKRYLYIIGNFYREIKMTKTMKKFGIFATAIMMLSFGSMSFSANSQANEIHDWQVKIGKRVAKKQVYPRSAMRRELEGRAKVKVAIDRNGTIISHEIITPTGKSVFDKEIPKLMERLNPLPAPPSSMTDSQLSFIIPLAWVIR